MKKKKDNLDIMFDLMKKNNGYITSGMLDSLGIHRMYLQMLIKKNYIRKVDKGIYLDVNVVNDKLYTFRLRNDHFIYSHFTSLFIHHFITTIKNEYDITVNNDYHNPTLKNNNIFYVSDDNYLVGKKKVKTDHGNYVICYDIERTICDIIRSRRRFLEKDVNRIIDKYLRNPDCNLNKVYNYAKKLKIYNEVYKYLNREG